MNEVADNITKCGRLVFTRFEMGRGMAPSVPRCLERAESNLRNCTRWIRTGFFSALLVYLDSVAAHIKRVLSLDRGVIKEAQKALQLNKGSQSTSHRLISGEMFKKMHGSGLVSTVCPVCGLEFSWQHFFGCFRLKEAPCALLRKSAAIVELCLSLNGFSRPI